VSQALLRWGVRVCAAPQVCRHTSNAAARALRGDHQRAGARPAAGQRHRACCGRDAAVGCCHTSTSADSSRCCGRCCSGISISSAVWALQVCCQGAGRPRAAAGGVLLVCAAGGAGRHAGQQRQRVHAVCAQRQGERGRCAHAWPLAQRAGDGSGHTDKHRHGLPCTPHPHTQAPLHTHTHTHRRPSAPSCPP
jgi:hypothetical protein